MNELEKALERISILRKEREQKQSKLQDGLKKEDGSTSFQPLQSHLNHVLVSKTESQATQVAKTPLGAQNRKESLLSTEGKLSGESMSRLTLALGRVCALQKQYGKTTAELETLVEGFAWVLGEYKIDVILDGIAKYVRRSSDIPAPADIMNIIDPPPQKLSGAVYISLKKQLIDNIFTTDEERAYIAAYERQEMDKLRGGSQELHDAQEEVKRYQKSLMIGCED